MTRSVVDKIMWVGRATVFMVVLSVVLALVFGFASVAFAHSGVDAKLFHLGHSNMATATSKLTASVAGSTLRLVNQSAGAAATALNLSVATGKPPLKVNASAGTATNLSADELDGKDSAEFLGNTEKAADSEMLDGQDSGAFAAARHDHDASYIQQSPTTAENGSINITGTMRTSGLLRTGSETGTSQPPEIYVGGSYDGLVVRRINSTTSGAGQGIARTDELTLERDGTYGGLVVAWPGGTSDKNTVNCMGISATGASVAKYIGAGGAVAGTAQVFTDAQNVVYATCSFGDTWNNKHVTQVTYQRISGDHYWVGTVVSSYNQ